MVNILTKYMKSNKFIENSRTHKNPFDDITDTQTFLKYHPN